MSIPGYQDFMLPLLKLAADGTEHTLPEAMDAIARQMNITDADREELLPSGAQSRFHNRISWAITYLGKSLLLEKCGRGRFKIAPRGIEVLAGNPVRIDGAFLDSP